jgi:subtilisin family serine protease
VLVEPNPGVDMEDFKGLLRRNGGHSKGAIGSLKVHVVEVPEHAEDAVAAALAHNPHIKYAEKDMLMAPTATSANDPNYSSAWHLDTLNAPVAWDSSKGDGVTVAVLDTGVDASHPDLQGQLVPGWNTYGNNADTSPLCSHGTSVAGIVAAASNNGIGVTSIAWNTKIMPMRVVGSDCWASASALAGAMSWAADHGARVASMSFANVSGSSTVTSGANYMRSKGGVVFAAAGNTGGASSIAPNPAMMVVSATDPNDSLRSFSSYGDFVDLAAPGGSIWTTSSGGGYGTFGGTSSSTPVAAAVAALVIAANPSLTPDGVENVLAGSSVDLGTPGKDSYFGYGRLDAAAAVAAAGSGGGTGGGSDPVDMVAPVVSIASPTGGTVSGSVSVTLDASDDTAVARVELFVDGTPIGTDSTAPFSISWDTSGHANGTAELLAYAYDAANNRGSSPAVSVTVDNRVVEDTSPPEVFILSPAETTIRLKPPWFRARSTSRYPRTTISPSPSSNAMWTAC